MKSINSAILDNLDDSTVRLLFDRDVATYSYSVFALHTLKDYSLNKIIEPSLKKLVLEAEKKLILSAVNRIRERIEPFCPNVVYTIHDENNVPCFFDSVSYFMKCIDELNNIDNNVTNINFRYLNLKDELQKFPIYKLNQEIKNLNIENEDINSWFKLESKELLSEKALTKDEYFDYIKSSNKKARQIIIGNIYETFVYMINKDKFIRLAKTDWNETVNLLKRWFEKNKANYRTIIEKSDYINLGAYDMTKKRQKYLKEKGFGTNVNCRCLNLTVSCKIALLFLFQFHEIERYNKSNKNLYNGLKYKDYKKNCSELDKLIFRNILDFLTIGHKDKASKEELRKLLNVDIPKRRVPKVGKWIRKYEDIQCKFIKCIKDINNKSINSEIGNPEDFYDYDSDNDYFYPTNQNKHEEHLEQLKDLVEIAKDATNRPISVNTEIQFKTERNIDFGLKHTEHKNKIKKSHFYSHDIPGSEMILNDLNKVEKSFLSTLLVLSKPEIIEFQIGKNKMKFIDYELVCPDVIDFNTIYTGMKDKTEEESIEESLTKSVYSIFNYEDFEYFEQLYNENIIKQKEIKVEKNRLLQKKVKIYPKMNIVRKATNKGEILENIATEKKYPKVYNSIVRNVDYKIRNQFREEYISQQNRGLWSIFCEPDIEKKHIEYKVKSIMIRNNEVVDPNDFFSFKKKAKEKIVKCFKIKYKLHEKVEMQFFLKIRDKEEILRIYDTYYKRSKPPEANPLRKTPDVIYGKIIEFVEDPDYYPTYKRINKMRTISLNNKLNKKTFFININDTKSILIKPHYKKIERSIETSNYKIIFQSPQFKSEKHLFITYEDEKLAFCDFSKFMKDDVSKTDKEFCNIWLTNVFKLGLVNIKWYTEDRNKIILSKMLIKIPSNTTERDLLAKVYKDSEKFYDISKFSERLNDKSFSEWLIGMRK